MMLMYAKHAFDRIITQVSTPGLDMATAYMVSEAHKIQDMFKARPDVQVCMMDIIDILVIGGSYDAMFGLYHSPMEE